MSNATRALTVEELRIAISVEKDDKVVDPESLPTAERLADICAGLVIIEVSNTVRLAHYTTQEYLKKKSVVPERLQMQSGYHSVICATYLAMDQFKTGACESKDAFKSRRDHNAFLDYAVGNLSDHIGSSDKLSTADAVARFIQDTGSVSSYLQAKECYDRSLYSWNYYPRGYHRLHVVSELGHEVIARNLIELDSAAVSAADEDGSTPLHRAADRGHEATVRLLIDRGAAVSAADEDGWTPLLRAADGGHEATVRLLIDRGAAVSAANEDGWTPLHRAAYGGHEATVRLLIDRGAAVSAADEDGSTPLQLAAKYRHEKVAQ